MTGPKGNGEFCFPETLRFKGKQNSLFPLGPVIKCFFLPPNSKIEQIIYGCHLRTLLQNVTKLRFQGAQPDHVQVESSSCCFSRELVSFDPWHVTHSPPIGKRI